MDRRVEAPCGESLDGYRSLNVSERDVYEASHPERMEITVVRVETGSGQLDEESITTVQFP